MRNIEVRLIRKEQAKEVLDVGDPSFRFLIVGIGFPPQLLHQLVYVCYQGTHCGPCFVCPGPETPSAIRQHARSNALALYGIEEARLLAACKSTTVCAAPCG